MRLSHASKPARFTWLCTTLWVLAMLCLMPAPVLAEPSSSSDEPTQEQLAAESENRAEAAVDTEPNPFATPDLTPNVTSAFVARLAPSDTADSYATVVSATTRGSLVALGSRSSLATQRFLIEPVADTDYCLIRNVGSQLVLDVKGGKAAAGTPVQQWTANGTLAQNWLIHKNDDGSYVILSALTTEYGARLSLAVDPATKRLQLAVYDVETPDIADDASPLGAVTSDEAVDTEVAADNLASEETDAPTANAGEIPAATSIEADRLAASGDQVDASVAPTDTAADRLAAADDQAVASADGLAAADEQADASADPTDAAADRLTAADDQAAAPSTSTNATEPSAVPGTPVLPTWQLTSPQTVANGTYRLTPGVATNRALDVASASLAKGANIRSYNSNGTNAQRYALTYNARTGYYTIAVVSSGLVLDVAGGSTKSGANIRQWTSNGSEAQQWDLEPTNTAGRYRIVSRKSGLVLDVAGGSAASGANVRLWRSNGSKAQQWQVSSVSPLANGVYAVPAFASQSLGLDVKGGKNDPYTNLQLYKLNGTVAQQFEIVEYATGLYTIRSVSNGLYISVHGASTTARTNVDFEGGTTIDDGRLWRAYPGVGGIVFVSASGLALDISGGSLKSGTNIWAYTRNNNASQRFVLKGVAGGKLLGITQIEAELPAATGAVGRTTSTRIGGKTYLLLPSYTNAQALQLQTLTTREGRDTEVATSENGTYTTLGPTSTINLTKGFAKESNGAYVVWLRTKGTNEARPVYVLLSAHIRALFLTSDNPADQGRAYIEASSKVHDNKTTGSMILVGADGEVAYDGALSQIKGRGNSTWRQVKKPYQIKLAKKASLLDGSSGNKAKTWVLLANYLDTTMERDFLSKKLALQLGLANTPDCEYVDLYYDGMYRGTYQLSEKVQVGSGRVEIHDLEQDNEDLNGDTSSHAVATAKNSFGRTFHYVTGMSDPADITGGYIVEFDLGTYEQERCWFETSIGTFAVKAPEDASYAQMKYISEYVQRTINEGKKASGNLGKYLDVESLAQTSLVNEVAKNPDWLKYSSTFFYKDTGALLKAGPVWDFDLAYGVARQDEETKYSLMAVEGLMSDQYGFFGNNAQFKTALTAAYKAGAPQVKALVTGGSSGKGAVGDTAATIQRSWVMNRLLWPHEATVYIPMTLSSRDDAVAHLWNWTAARVNWMNNRFTGTTTPVVNLGKAVSGTFEIVGGTGRALAIADGSTANGANVYTWKRDGSKAQQFAIKAIGRCASGEWYYRITNVKSNKVLEAAGGKTALGTNVVQHTYNGTSAQHWILRRTSTDSGARFQIVNLKSRLALDIGGGENKNGANVGLYLVCGNNKAQNWFLR